MHLENILLHLFNAILLYLVACRLAGFFKLTMPWLPFVTAALFALHPVNTEAVNWITSRTDLLAATGVYLALYGLLVYATTGRVLPGVLSAFGLGFGVLAKEPALFFLPGALVIIWWSKLQEEPVGGRAKRTGKIIVTTAYTAVISGYFLLRWFAFHSDRGIEGTVKAFATVQSSADATNSLTRLFCLYSPASQSDGFLFQKDFLAIPSEFRNDYYCRCIRIPGVLCHSIDMLARLSQVTVKWCGFKQLICSLFGTVGSVKPDGMDAGCRALSIYLLRDIPGCPGLWPGQKTSTVVRQFGGLIARNFASDRFCLRHICKKYHLAGQYTSFLGHCRKIPHEQSR